MALPDRLKELRKTKQISQKELASIINISARAWRFYESGDREPTITNLIALADYFDVSLDYLVGRSDDPTRR